MYKVVRKIDSALMSCVIHAEGWCKEYSKDFWTTSETGLFVFQTLEDAQEFAAGMLRGVEIWEVDVADPLPLPPVLCSLPCSAPSTVITAFWEKGPANSLSTQIPPEGTRLFKQVRLVRRIPNATFPEL
jgi:hypothetical protein